MKIKIQIRDVKTGALIIEHLSEIVREGDLEREVALAVNNVRKKGIEPFGWCLQVDKG